MALPNWQRTITTTTGDVVPGAEVEVVNEATGLPADLYMSRAGTSAKTNPFFADSSGFAEFYADPGEYRITATGAAGSQVWRYEVLTGTAALMANDTGENSLLAAIDNSSTASSKKSDYDKSALELNGITLQASQEFGIVINDVRVIVEIGETVTLPTLSNATDYKVYAAADGTLSAQEYDTPAPANSALIGGFHAAYSDAAIVERSLWDFAWKPATGSPRAMALSLSERVWADIYLMDSDYGINGHSRPDAQIADGGSPPKRPIAYGGDGSAAYSSFTQYLAKEMAAAAGKRLPDYDEFADIAYGTVTGQVSGSDPVTTKHQAGLRSAIGLEQATGAMWLWGQENWDRGNGSSGYAWYAADTDGAGQVYTSGSAGVGASLFGGDWDGSGQSGPRCSHWFIEPWYSSSYCSARAVSDHTKYGV